MKTLSKISVDEGKIIERALGQSSGTFGRFGINVRGNEF